MEQKVQRRSVVVAFLVAAVLALAAVLTVLFARPNKASGEDSPAVEQAPFATVYLGRGGITHETGVYYRNTHETGWNEFIADAVSRRKYDTEAYVKFIIYSDWVSDNNKLLGSDEADEDGNQSYFSEGRIVVPTGAKVVIDLYGHKIDRALESAKANGQVMIVQGELTVDDSVGGGKITGGFNTKTTNGVYGGCVRVDGGTFDFKGGAITDNHTSSTDVGLGVHVTNNGVFNMYDRAVISDNTPDVKTRSVYGGGVCVYTTGKFTMHGGTIENNHGYFGGGVCIYGSAAGATPTTDNLHFNMFGGIIQKNAAYILVDIAAPTYVKSGVTYSYVLKDPDNPDAPYDLDITADELKGLRRRGYGGGLSVYGRGNADITGGEIRYNTAGTQGGGVSMYINKAVQSKFNFGGDAQIHHNVVASRYYQPEGGGICFNVASLTTNIYNGKEYNPIAATISGGKIMYNYAVANSATEDVYTMGKKVINSYLYWPFYNNTAYGGGVECVHAQVEMTGGIVARNRTLSIVDFHATDEDLDAILDDLMYNTEHDFDGDLHLTNEIKKDESGEYVKDEKGNYVWTNDVPVVDGYASIGGGVYVYTREPTSRKFPCYFEITNGTVAENRASSGGGVNLDGAMHLYGGTVINNYAHHGGGVYIQGGGTVALSGKPVVSENYNTTGLDDKILSNMEVIDSGARRPNVTDSLSEDAEIHIYVTSNILEANTAITQNYGKNNRMFVSVSGEDGDNEDGDGVWVYANPYRYFVTDDVYAIQSGKVLNDMPEYISYQYFVMISDYQYAYNPNDKIKVDNGSGGQRDETKEETIARKQAEMSAANKNEVGVAGGRVTYTVKYSDNSTKTFEYGNKYNVNEDNLWNYTATTYGDEVYPVSVVANVYERKLEYKDENITVVDNYHKTAAEYQFDDDETHGWYYLVNTQEFTISTGEQPEAKVYEAKIRCNPEYKITRTTSVENGKTTVTISESATELSGIYASFFVVVKARQLTTGDVEVTLGEHEEYHYDGNAKEPTVTTVTLPGNKMRAADITLVLGEDYTVSYNNNRNAGTKAEVIITFHGNYVGTAIEYFTIGPSLSADISTSVSWQVKNSAGAWVELTEDMCEEAFTFTPDADNGYQAKDQRGNIRALLTATDNNATNDDDKIKLKQAVYAYGVTRTEAEEEGETYKQNASMYLSYMKGDSFSEFGVPFGNAGEYTVRVMGESNYRIVGGRSVEVVMNKMPLALLKKDYENYELDGERLWKLLIGEGDDTAIGELLTDAVYVEKVNGEDKVVTGTGNGTDLFARYRGVPLALFINGNYKLDSVKLTFAQLLAMADSFSYTPNEGVVGEEGKVSDLTTELTIKFDSNYELTVDGFALTELKISKAWKIVTMSNTLRMSTGEEITSYELGTGWTFGEIDVKDYEFRPEHGNTVIYTYYLETNGDPQFIDRFALVFSNDRYNAVRRFYGMKDDDDMVVDTDKAFNDPNYLYNFHYELKAGTYSLYITVPQNEPVEGTHRHWWDGDVVAADNGTKYYEFTYKFTFSIAVYEMTDDGADENITVTFPENASVEYTGKANNFVHPVVKLFEKELVEGVDYELACDQVTVSNEVHILVIGINSLSGRVLSSTTFAIVQANTYWQTVPSIMYWTYTGYAKDVNLITAKASVPLDDDDDLWFAVSRDVKGDDVVEGLDHFTIDADGNVDDSVADVFRTLSVADYYLFAHITERANYRGLNPDPVHFRVFQANNSWEITPTVNTWTEGEYTDAETHIVANAVFGKAHVHIEGDDGTVYFDTDDGVDILAKAKAGRYTLTAYVDGSTDYTGLDVFTVVFNVFEKPGLPWWATLLITVGALLLAALIIFILWKKGVFQILTEKIVVAIRTRASVEATIASVRAAKKMEEGKQSIADAKRRERIEKMRRRAAEQRALSPEERAAQLEAKAQAEAERAEKILAKSEATRAKAAKMRGEAEANPAKAEAADNAPEKEVPEAVDAPKTAEPVTEAPETPSEATPAPETEAAATEAPKAEAAPEKAEAPKSQKPRRKNK